MVVLWLVIVLFILVIIGMPIFGAMGIASLVHFLDTGRESTLIIITQRIYSGLSSFTFLAVPLFVLAGEIMTRGGLIGRLIGLASALVGHYRGGLAQVNIASSIFFAGISGSGQADVAAMGSTLIPAMTKEGYPRGFAAALTAVSSTLSPMLPPSIILIVYGAIFQVPIVALFAAGLSVGLVLAASYMILTYFLVRAHNIPRHPRATFRQVLSAGRRAMVPMGLPVIILGGIFGGLFTAVEAAAVAVAYAIFVTMIYYRTVSFRDLGGIILAAAMTSAAILILAGSALAFAYIVAIQHVPAQVMNGIMSVTTSPFLIVSGILFVLIVAGMFVGRTANVLLFGPIIIPIFYQLGYSPVHTCMIIIMALGIGHLTPPVGGTLLTAALVGRVPLMEILKYMWPHIIAEIVMTIVVILVPAISIFLPQLLGLGGV